MKDHYNLIPVEFEKLNKSVSLGAMIKSIPEFDIYKTGLPISKIMLMHFIDKHGDFNVGDSVLKRIAKAVFNSLPNNTKVEVIHYIAENCEED